MKPVELLKTKNYITIEDFRKIYPNQKEHNLRCTASKYLRALIELGIVQPDNGGWKVRTDTLKAMEEFESLRERLGYEGDLYEFVVRIFKTTGKLLKEKTELEIIALEHGVSVSAILSFVETLLDEIVWKTEEDLKKLEDDIKEGRIVFVADKVKNRFLSANEKEIKQLCKREDFSEEEAFIFLLNNFLSFVPVSYSLWKKAQEIAGEDKDLEEWLGDKVVESGKGRFYELVPVNKKLYDKMKDEIDKLPEAEQERFKEKFVRNLNTLLEKIRREARDVRMRKRLSNVK